MSIKAPKKGSNLQKALCLIRAFIITEQLEKWEVACAEMSKKKDPKKYVM